MRLRKIMSNLNNLSLGVFICILYLMFIVKNNNDYNNGHQTNQLSDEKMGSEYHSSKISTDIRSTSESTTLKYENIPLDLSKPSSFVNFAHTVEGNYCYNNSANYLNSDISSYMKKGDYRSLYRSAMDYAINKISTVVEQQEFIVTCSFPGFNQEESYHIWNLAERRMRIKQTCKKYAKVLKDEPNEKHLYWDKEFNFGYCGRFKAGTTTWMSRMLDWHGVNSSLLDTQEIQDEIHKLYPPLRGENIKEIRNEKPLIFSFFRDPLSRLVSAYLNNIMRHKRPPLSKKLISTVRGKSLVTIVNGIKDNIVENYDVDEKIVNKLLHLDKIKSKENNYDVPETNSQDTRLNFREFTLLAVKQVLECFHEVECLLDIDPHWQPQYVRCSPCQIEVDVPGQLESFEKDSNILLKILNNDTSTINRELNVELSDHYEEDFEISRTFFDTLNDDEIQLTALAYLFDFNLSGYLFTQFLTPE